MAKGDGQFGIDSNYTNGGSLLYNEFDPSAAKCPHEVDAIFLVLTLTIGVMSAAAIFLNALLVRFLYKSRIFHPNVRLLLKNVAIAVFLCSLFMFLRFSTYHPFLILIGFQHMMIKNATCALVEIPFYVCSFTLILSMTAVGVERFSATLKSKIDSENVGRGTKITVLLIWLVASANSFAYYLYARFRPSSMCYCQMINNMETTRTLLPVVVVHAFFYTVYLLSLTFIRRFYDTKENAEAGVNLILVVHHLIPLEMLIQPILIVRRSEHLKKIALEMFPRLSLLWGVRNTTGHQQFHSLTGAGGKQRRSAAWLFGSPPPHDAGSGGASLAGGYSTCGASLKRRPPTCGAPDASVVDYRMKPETHQDILEHIWSAKPLLAHSSSDATAPSEGGAAAAVPVISKKSSVKRNSLAGLKFKAKSKKRSECDEHEAFSQ